MTLIVCYFRYIIKQLIFCAVLYLLMSKSNLPVCDMCNLQVWDRFVPYMEVPYPAHDEKTCNVPTL